MDHTFLSLFSGIGLHDLGLERAGWQCIGQCECNEFGQSVLRKHWPSVPIWKDVRDVTGAELRRQCGALPTLITGGFPCTQISCAGKGEGIGTKDDPTEVSGLWWEMRRIIEDVRPAWVLAENVPALRTRGSDAVLGSLEELGYACWPLVVGSWAVGAPHKRDRVWLVANDVRQRKCGQDGEAWRRLRTRYGSKVSREDDRGACAFELPQEAEGLADGQGGGFGADWRTQREGGYTHQRSETLHGARWPARPGEPQHEWENPRLLESGVGRPTDGAARRMARRRTAQLKAIGNANPPHVPEAIGRAIMQVMEEV
jgi:DNA (cytosine-5)-methyltransferase 1